MKNSIYSVYFIFDGDKVVYIGATANSVESRVSTHVREKEYLNKRYSKHNLPYFDSIEFFNLNECKMQEAYWIYKLNPKLNSKTYFNCMSNYRGIDSLRSGIDYLFWLNNKFIEYKDTNRYILENALKDVGVISVMGDKEAENFLDRRIDHYKQCFDFTNRTKRKHRRLTKVSQ